MSKLIYCSVFLQLFERSCPSKESKRPKNKQTTINPRTTAGIRQCLVLPDQFSDGDKLHIRHTEALLKLLPLKASHIHQRNFVVVNAVVSIKEWFEVLTQEDTVGLIFSGVSTFHCSLSLWLRSVVVVVFIPAIVQSNHDKLHRIQEELEVLLRIGKWVNAVRH